MNKAEFNRVSHAMITAFIDEKRVVENVSLHS